VERLAEIKEPWAIALLEKATADSDPQVRAAALLAMQTRAPDAALKALRKLLQDQAVFVRVHASSLVAKLTSPSLAEAVAAALQSEKDPACRIYLEQAQGKAPPKPVNRFDAERVQFGMCGYASHASESPMTWYYNLTPEVNAVGRKAHEAGKILIGRANETAKNPVQVLFHPIWRDLWWTNLRKELKDLEWLDGIVIGEESMYAPPWGLWADGWRCFCVEAGIDAEKVAGDLAKSVVANHAMTGDAVRGAVPGQSHGCPPIEPCVDREAGSEIGRLSCLTERQRQLSYHNVTIASRNPRVDIFNAGDFSSS
jgi:hypothetical protein